VWCAHSPARRADPSFTLVVIQDPAVGTEDLGSGDHHEEGDAAAARQRH
jgi:hypothetical protein